MFEYALTLASDVISNSGDFSEGAFIQQGDSIEVVYSDPQDASGESRTVTNNATFDLRNGVLQSDKNVYNWFRYGLKLNRA